MKASEAAVLLAAIARTDKRTFGDAEVISWSELMTTADVPLKDAIEAAQDHFGTSHDYLMPIHIIETVRAVRRQRLTDAGDPPMPGDLTYDQEKAWRRLWCGHVKDGLDRKAAATAASVDMNLPPEIERPPVDRQAVMALWGQRRSIPGRQAHCNHLSAEHRLTCALPPNHKAANHYCQGIEWAS